MMWIAVGALIFGVFIAGHAVAARLIGVRRMTSPTPSPNSRPTSHCVSTANWHRPGTTRYQAAHVRHEPQLRWPGSFVAASFVAKPALHALQQEQRSARLRRLRDPTRQDLNRRQRPVPPLAEAIGSLAARTPTGDMSSLLRQNTTAAQLTLGCSALLTPLPCPQQETAARTPLIPHGTHSILFRASNPTCLVDVDPEHDGIEPDPQAPPVASRSRRQRRGSHGPPHTTSGRRSSSKTRPYSRSHLLFSAAQERHVSAWLCAPECASGGGPACERSRVPDPERLLSTTA